MCSQLTKKIDLHDSCNFILRMDGGLSKSDDKHIEPMNNWTFARFVQPEGIITTGSSRLLNNLQYAPFGYMRLSGRR